MLPQGLVHFIEVLQFNRANYASWYDVLNLGFKVAPTAGTDYPCGDQNIPGHERFYAKVEGDFNYESWLDAVKGEERLSRLVRCWISRLMVLILEAKSN